jgi:ribosomal protein S18 acetylase RimI-like enzyme
MGSSKECELKTTPAIRPMSDFIITEINEDSWPQILQIQAEVYVDIEPESLATLRSKWQNSPECCSLCVTEQGVCAYLLAHAWHSESPPKLYQPAPASPQGDVLFIHDLAVSKRVAGMGVGTQMVSHLLNSAQARGFRDALLVAVQDSVPFWQKFGFQSHKDCPPNPCYVNTAVVMQRHLDEQLN